MRNCDANWKLLRILKCKVTDYSNKNGYTGDQQGHIVDKKVILWINGVILSILRVVDKQGIGQTSRKILCINRVILSYMPTIVPMVSLGKVDK